MQRVERCGLLFTSQCLTIKMELLRHTVTLGSFLLETVYTSLFEIAPFEILPREAYSLEKCICSGL